MCVLEKERVGVIRDIRVTFGFALILICAVIKVKVYFSVL